MSGYNSSPQTDAFLRNLESRVSTLERTRTIPVSIAPPTAATADGAMQGENAGTKRLWVKIGGVWVSTVVS